MKTISKIKSKIKILKKVKKFLLTSKMISINLWFQKNKFRKLSMQLQKSKTISFSLRSPENKLKSLWLQKSQLMLLNLLQIMKIGSSSCLTSLKKFSQLHQKLHTFFLNKKLQHSFHVNNLKLILKKSTINGKIQLCKKKKNMKRLQKMIKKGIRERKISWKLKDISLILMVSTVMISCFQILNFCPMSFSQKE